MAVNAPTRRMLVAGGGPAAIETALALRELGSTAHEVVLIAPGRHLTLRTLQDGLPRAIRLPLPELAARTAIEHVRDTVSAVDLQGRRVHTQDGLELGYDGLVLAVGARAVTAVPGALTYRDPRDVGRLHEALGHLVRNGHRPRVVFAVPAGVDRSRPLYELALHTASRLTNLGVDAELAVVTPETRLPHDELETALTAARIGVRAGVVPGFVEDGRLWAGPQAHTPADLVVALPHRAGPGIEGLPSDAAGFTLVDGDGAIEGADRAYAIGSMATREPHGDEAAQADAVARRLTGVRATPDRVQGWPRLAPYVREQEPDITPLG